MSTKQSTIYYIYAYLRKSNLTPYYIGKGKGNRAWNDHGYHRPPRNKSLIVIMESNLTEVGAFALERRYIEWYGRKDIGTGILINQTNGGEGATGYVPTDEVRKKLSDRSKGSNNGMYGRKHSNKVKLESSKRRSLTNSIRRWYNNGVESKFHPTLPGPEWKLGRINQKPTTSGNKWYNNGIIAVSRKVKPEGNEWILGMLPKK